MESKGGSGGCGIETGWKMRVVKIRARVAEKRGGSEDKGVRIEFWERGIVGLRERIRGKDKWKQGGKKRKDNQSREKEKGWKSDGKRNVKGWNRCKRSI